MLEARVQSPELTSLFLLVFIQASGTWLLPFTVFLYFIDSSSISVKVEPQQTLTMKNDFRSHGSSSLSHQCYQWMGYSILPSLLSLLSPRAQRARDDGIATATFPSYSSSAVATDLDKGNLKDKGLLLAHGLKVEESWQQELAATGHFASEVRKQGPKNACVHHPFCVVQEPTRE